MTDRQIPGQMSLTDDSEDKKVKEWRPKKLQVMGDKYGEPGFKELYDSDTVVDHDKVDNTPPYLEAQEEYQRKLNEAAAKEKEKEDAMSSFEAVIKGIFATTASEFILNIKEYIDRYEEETKRERSGGNSEDFFIQFFGLAMAKLSNVHELTTLLKDSPDYERYLRLKEEYNRFISQKEYRDYLSRPRRTR